MTQKRIIIIGAHGLSAATIASLLADPPEISLFAMSEEDLLRKEALSEPDYLLPPGAEDVANLFERKTRPEQAPPPPKAYPKRPKPYVPKPRDQASRGRHKYGNNQGHNHPPRGHPRNGGRRR